MADTAEEVIGDIEIDPAQRALGDKYAVRMLHLKSVLADVDATLYNIMKQYFIGNPQPLLDLSDNFTWNDLISLFIGSKLAKNDVVSKNIILASEGRIDIYWPLPKKAFSAYLTATNMSLADYVESTESVKELIPGVFIHVDFANDDSKTLDLKDIVMTEALAAYHSVNYPGIYIAYLSRNVEADIMPSLVVTYTSYYQAMALRKLGQQRALDLNVSMPSTESVPTMEDVPVAGASGEGMPSAEYELALQEERLKNERLVAELQLEREAKERHMQEMEVANAARQEEIALLDNRIRMEREKGINLENEIADLKNKQSGLQVSLNTMSSGLTRAQEALKYAEIKLAEEKTMREMLERKLTSTSSGANVEDVIAKYQDWATKTADIAQTYDRYMFYNRIILPLLKESGKSPSQAGIPASIMAKIDGIAPIGSRIDTKKDITTQLRQLSNVPVSFVYEESAPRPVAAYSASAAPARSRSKSATRFTTSEPQPAQPIEIRMGLGSGKGAAMSAAIPYGTVSSGGPVALSTGTIPSTAGSYDANLMKELFRGRSYNKRIYSVDQNASSVSVVMTLVRLAIRMELGQPINVAVSSSLIFIDPERTILHDAWKTWHGEIPTVPADKIHIWVAYEGTPPSLESIELLRSSQVAQVFKMSFVEMQDVISANDLYYLAPNIDDVLTRPDLAGANVISFFNESNMSPPSEDRLSESYSGLFQNTPALGKPYTR